MHWDTFKQASYSTVGGDGGCRVSEIRAGTTSLVPDHKAIVTAKSQSIVLSSSDEYGGEKTFVSKLY